MCVVDPVRDDKGRPILSAIIPSERLRETVDEIYTSPGFFRELRPIAGALDAVRICTSPLNQYRNCVPEKHEWVERHLGAEFVGRMIVTKDKTLMHGDVLVDEAMVIAQERRLHITRPLPKDELEAWLQTSRWKTKS